MSIGMIRKRQREAEVKEEVIQEVVEETQEQLFICPICGKEYKTERNFTKHMETKHKEGE